MQDNEQTDSQDFKFSQESFGEFFSCSLENDLLVQPDLKDDNLNMGCNSVTPEFGSTNHYVPLSEEFIPILDDYNQLADTNHMMSSTSSAGPVVQGYDYELHAIQDVNSCGKNLPPPYYSVDSAFQSKPACLPASNNWKGFFGFDIYFEQINDFTSKKKDIWKYSGSKDKLYVKRTAACPINFVTSHKVPPGTTISVTLVFTKPCDGTRHVERCLLHQYEDRNNGVDDYLSNHIVRCECPNSQYTADPANGKCATIPYTTPGDDQPYSTYIFKFECFSSCEGGINRRSTKLVFSLESGGQIIGRRSMDLKICACVNRDFKNEHEKEKIIKFEGKTENNFKPSMTKKLKGIPSTHLQEILNFVAEIQKKPKISKKNDDKMLCLTASTYKEQQFLKAVQSFFQFVERSSSSSSDDDSSPNNDAGKKKK